MIYGANSRFLSVCHRCDFHQIGRNWHSLGSWRSVQNLEEENGSKRDDVACDEHLTHTCDDKTFVVAQSLREQSSQNQLRGQHEADFLLDTAMANGPTPNVGVGKINLN